MTRRSKKTENRKQKTEEENPKHEIRNQGNPKHEIRSTKSETNPKFKGSNDPNDFTERLCRFEPLNFEHLILFRISIFGFRICFKFLISIFGFRIFFTRPLTSVL
ncbi:MAG: hypothetical protein A2Z25_05690 [Planctomycetes bacterium RBG_16_55_9]|nr:MAG: hypothetical protein A2Z25_05690 [Planctomycetes bacterium RBG_16_55_9]